MNEFYKMSDEEMQQAIENVWYNLSDYRTRDETALRKILLTASNIQYFLSCDLMLEPYISEEEIAFLNNLKNNQTAFDF